MSGQTGEVGFAHQDQLSGLTGTHLACAHAVAAAAAPAASANSTNAVPLGLPVLLCITSLQHMLLHAQQT